MELKNAVISLAVFFMQINSGIIIMVSSFNIKKVLIRINLRKARSFYLCMTIYY